MSGRFAPGTRGYGVVVASVLGLFAIGGAVSCVVDFAQFTRAVGRRAPAVVAYGGNAMALPGTIALVALCLIELIHPPERWRNRTFLFALVCLAGIVALPIAFRVAVASNLPARGYVRCPGRVVGYTLPATRWVRGDPALCRQVARGAALG